MEGLSAICAGLCIIEEDDDGNQIGYSTDTYCLDNLKDLLRFLRRDDPQSREVFKQVCKWNIVGKDLIPIIEHFQDDRNLVLNAVKVLVFLTMPVEPTSHDIPQQIDYLWGLKSSITYSDTVPVIVSLLESPLENLEREAFTEDDWKLVQLVLTLFRNMLAIQDISPHQKAGGSATQFLSIRDKFLEQLFHENVMDLILVLTQHVGGSCGYLCHDNLLLLEIFHYLFIGQEPELIAKALSKDLKVDGDANTSINSLKSIMEEEEKRKLTRLRNMSCCTQFSGTFTRLSMDGSKTLLKGNPCSASSETLLKSHKVNRGPRKKMARDHGRLPSTKDSILVLLHDFVNQLLSGGYNVLMQSIRQDIEKEHHTIQSSDVIIFFQVAQFITSFQYHKTLYLKPKVEADSCEASANSQADNTLFKGNICGPIAATINESMFLLVISKWRYAYDGLKETKEYNFVSAAGSLMTIMIRMLESVLKVSPEDSKEPQTARVLLYKLFYDQTDEGMTQFLLNQIKSFDTHKQAKSDLIDLVETIYVIIRLMENLQARGTLRVSRKPRKKKAKRKLNDKNENVEHPIGDDVPIENVVGNLGCEPPLDSTVLSEKVIKTRSDGKDEDMGIPCQIDEPVTFESETNNQESHLPDVTKKASDEINDDISNGFGDSSSDEQQAATDEVDFKVSTLVSALANNAIIKNLCQLLKFYKSNSLRTNHYIISLLRKICEDLELSPMLYQLSLLNTFHMILDEQKSSPSKEYENIVTFLTNLVRRMMRKMKSQPLLFIEVLFWKARKECHYINCESLMREVGHLKRESEKYESVFKDEDFASTQGKGLGHRSIADALGDDEADFLYSHEIGKQKDEHPYNLKIQKESCEEKGEKITSMANEGIHSKGNSDSKGTLELESERLPKRRKRLVLDENLEGNIKNLYEKYKNDRHCSRLIAEALDPDVKVSPVQVSSKLRQLGLTVRPKNRMLQDGKSNHLREEEGTSRNESNLNFEKENSAFRPLQTKKRVRAFSEAQELTIKVLFEQFKNHRRCSHMIANALDADGKFTAAQVSRKLKQLGLHIPQRKRSKDNMHLMDEDHISHSAESAEDSGSETLLSLKKRSVNKKSERDAEVASNKKVERKLLEDNSNDETLSSIFGKTRRLLAAPKGVDLPATLVKHSITENNPGFRQDTQDVAERYGYEQLGETEANDLVDVTLNEISNTSSGKQVEGISVGNANNLPRQHMFYDLANQLSDYEDDVVPVASQGGAVLRRKLRMVVDFEDDD